MDVSNHFCAEGIIVLIIILSILMQFAPTQALQCYSCGWDLETSDETEEVRERCWHETPGSNSTIDCAQSHDPVSEGSDKMIGCYSLMAKMSEEEKEFGRGCMTDEFYNCTGILIGQPLESGDCHKFTNDSAKVCFREDSEDFKVTKLEDFILCYCSSGDLCNTEDGASKDNHGENSGNSLKSLHLHGSLKMLVYFFIEVRIIQSVVI